MSAARREVVVVGGSVAGLLVAAALARDGHRVALLEADAAPLPASPADAVRRWPRPGAPQLRHSHAFLARLHNGLAERLPELLDFLLASGAERMRFADVAAAVVPGASFLPEDEEITMLACRRVVFEWALRRFCSGLPGVSLRAGARVAGLVADPGPVLRGVRLASGERLSADLVVDASGRQTRVARWLEALGAEPPRLEREPCGIFYASRFYRLAPGAAAPRLEGPMGADLGFLKYGIFPGDARSFSITLAASPDDPALRPAMRQPGFDALAAALPATRPWVDPERAEPISGVAAMAKLENLRRFPLRDGAPLAAGLFLVGDALVHTNPIVGRGCSLAALGAFALTDALRAAPRDDRDAALAYDAAVEREIVPWYEAVRLQDRNAIETAALQQRGEDPFETRRPDGSVDPRATLRCLVRDGFLPALREDVAVLRAFLRIFNLLEQPRDLLRDPQLLARILASYERRRTRDPAEHGLSRERVVALLERAAA